MPHFGFWDALLLIAVPIQATVMAYLHSPRWKAFMLTIPVPFSISYLALGRPIDAHQVIAMLLLLGYTHAVTLLHYRLGLPILPSITAAAVGYCAAGALLAPWVPGSETTFWVSLVAVTAFAVVLYRLTPHVVEPGHRTPLPVWVKFPAIMLVIAAILAIKGYLQGFLSLFPMVGVVTSYEGRHSLRTIARQIPVVLMVLAPFFAAIHVVERPQGPAWALAVGWAVFLPALYLVTRHQWAAEDRQLQASAQARAAVD
jgi:hypothetical protein